ncbi:YhgE/Pip domain-containing protein [Lactobacillus iners]|uniref:YhgE/Pip domain-containing protein n=1 Tax=Lactobacillus iners TaxID=147802 RepID=UPI0025509B57|nr:YhgE/Pip domain-containing protein [Lactobacillus iners]MDK8131957.1 YhgE/Pip domain-containing protein [Lactobacillus iners]
MKKIKQKLSQHNLVFIIMFAVAILAPVLYSLSFIKSVWDPYAGAKNLPIAVVNNDQAVNYNNKKLAVGDKIVSQLKHNKQMKWLFVTEEEAKKGLQNRKFYTVVTIPNDFSKNATTVLTSHPQKMKLYYKTNDSLNYLGSTMSDMALIRLNGKVRSSVTKAYANAMFDQLRILGKGMHKAANGAKQISTGMISLQDGSKKYVAGVSKISKGMQILRVSVQPLATGSKKLVEGSSKLYTGINKYTNGVSKLYLGSEKLIDATPILTQGINEFNTGLFAYTSGVGSLSSGLSKLSSNSYRLRAGGRSLLTASNNFDLLNVGSQKVNAGVSAFNSKLSDSNLLGTLNGALSLQGQVFQLESQLATVQETLKVLKSLDLLSIVDNIKQYAEKLSQAKNINQAISYSDQNAANADKIAKLVNSDSQINESTKQKILGLVNDIKTNAQDGQASLEAYVGESVVPLLLSLKGMQSKLSPTQLQGLSSQIANIESALVGAKKLLSETKGLLSKVSDNKDMLNNMPDRLKKLSAATSQIAAGTQQLVDSKSKIKQLVSGIDEYTDGVDMAMSGAATLDANSAKLLSGFDKLKLGFSQYAGGIVQINGGLKLLDLNSKTLLSGSNQLNVALIQLNEKVPALLSGIDRLANGSSQLNSKSSILLQGINKLRQGSGTLSDKLSQGADKLNSTQAADANSDMFSDPAELKHDTVSVVPNYGHALAPFIMATALFIGVLILLVEFPANRRMTEITSYRSLILREFKLAIIACLGMVLVQNIILIASGLKVFNVVELFTICIAYTLAMLGIMQLLTFMFGRWGLLPGLLLFVLQIGGAGGMFPIEVTNSFFQNIHQFLPMSYAIAGLRQAITSGLGTGYFMSNLMVLILLAIVAYVGLVIAIVYKFTNTATETVTD